MRILAIVIALLTVLVTGCAQQAETKPVKFEQVTYSYTGGIAGFDQQLLIHPDGSFQVTDRGTERKTGKLTGAELDQLDRLLASVDWPSLPPKYVDPRVADAIFETVNLRTADRQYETVVGTGATAPGELSSLIAFLRQTLQGHR